MSTLFTHSNPLVTKPTSEAMKKSSRGIISGIASKATSIASALTLVPITAPIAGTVATVSSIVGSIAGAFGFDKPTSLQTTDPIKIGYFDLAHSTGIEQSPVLATTQENQVERLGAEVGYTEIEDSILDIAMRPQVIYSGQLNQSATTTDSLFSIPVHPAYMPSPNPAPSVTNMVMDLLPTYSSFVANLFRYWRGSMTYQFHFYASSFHSGRIRIVWTPDPDRTINAASNVQDSISTVVDIRGNTKVGFSVPYLLPQPFARCNLAEVTYANDYNWSFGSFGVPDTIIPIHNGNLNLYWENIPVFPSVPSPPIHVVVYSACGADIQFAEPTTESFTNMQAGSAGYGGARVKFLGNPGFNGEVVSASAPQLVGDTLVFDSVPQSDVDQPVVDVNEITNFQELAEPVVTQEPNQDDPVSNPVYTSVSDPTLSELAARPALLDHFQWTPSMDIGKGTVYDTFRALNVPTSAVRTIFSKYRYARFDIVVRIRINGTRFHYGALAYTHTPFGAVTSGNLSRLSITELSGYNGGVLTPDVEETHTIRLPYIYQDNHFTMSRYGALPTDVNTNKSQGIGPLFLYVLSPLGGGTVATAEVSPVNVTLYTHLENVVVSGPQGAPSSPPTSSPPISVSLLTPAADGGYPVNSINGILAINNNTGPGEQEDVIVFEDSVPQGYTMQDVRDEPCESLVPGSTALVAGTAMHGEVITHVKQLVSRPGHAGHIYPTKNGSFVSHFGQLQVFYPQLRPYKGAPHNSVTPFVSTKASQSNASFLDALRSLYLIERGSVCYKFVGENGNPLGIDLMMSKDNMISWNNSTQTYTSDNMLDADMAVMAGQQDSGRVTAGSHYVPSIALMPPEVIVPYHTFSLFHYTPRLAFGDVLGLNIDSQVTMPKPVDTPGVRVSSALAQNNIRINVLKSAADDFQFAKLIPPRMFTFTTRRFCTPTV